MKKKKSLWERPWWGGIGSLSTIASLVVSVMVYIQATRVQVRTMEISRQMDCLADIRCARENIDKYLSWDWHDKAVMENNRMNDSLRQWGQDADSTCFLYFHDLYEDQCRMGLLEAALITKRYLDSLR